MLIFYFILSQLLALVGILCPLNRMIYQQEVADSIFFFQKLCQIIVYSLMSAGKPWICHCSSFCVCACRYAWKYGDTLCANWLLGVKAARYFIKVGFVYWHLNKHWKYYGSYYSILLPLANEVWGKVLFYTCLSFCSRGVSACGWSPLRGGASASGGLGVGHTPLELGTNLSEIKF